MKPYILTPGIIKLLSYTQPVKPLLLPGIKPLKKPELYSEMVMHEIRNPLSNILLAAEMMKGTTTDNNQEIYLDIILRASARINSMVTDLLKGEQVPEPATEKYFIHQLLDEVLVFNEDKILLKNISVRKDCTTIDCKVAGDMKQMKMAITNIIVNAIDAMPAVKGKLKLVTKSINGRCVIEIRDNGIGINKEDLKDIFNPFFTTKKNGIGLGLSTTLEILMQNHVTPHVHSVPGKGTIFSLSFNNQ
jgi:signal transduction histidine kinase